MSTTGQTEINTDAEIIDWLARQIVGTPVCIWRQIDGTVIVQMAGYQPIERKDTLRATLRAAMERE